MIVPMYFVSPCLPTFGKETIKRMPTVAVTMHKGHLVQSRVFMIPQVSVSRSISVHPVGIVLFRHDLEKYLHGLEELKRLLSDPDSIDRCHSPEWMSKHPNMFIEKIYDDGTVDVQFLFTTRDRDYFMTVLNVGHDDVVGTHEELSALLSENEEYPA